MLCGRRQKFKNNNAISEECLFGRTKILINDLTKIKWLDMHFTFIIHFCWKRKHLNFVKRYVIQRFVLNISMCPFAKYPYEKIYIQLVGGGGYYFVHVHIFHKKIFINIFAFDILIKYIFKKITSASIAKIFILLYM